MNPLEAYFKESGENPTKLAERLNLAPSTITRPLRGERNVSMDVALEIERGTAGRVTAEQFMAICLEARRKHDAAGAELGA